MEIFSFFREMGKRLNVVTREGHQQIMVMNRAIYQAQPVMIRVKQIFVE